MPNARNTTPVPITAARRHHEPDWGYITGDGDGGAGMSWIDVGAETIALLVQSATSVGYGATFGRKKDGSELIFSLNSPPAEPKRFYFKAVVGLEGFAQRLAEQLLGGDSGGT